MIDHSSSAVLVLVAALALTACGRSAPADPAAAAEALSTLTAEGSAFVLGLPDGTVLRGTQLEGATVHLALGEGGVVPVRLASIVADDEHPDILRHDLRIPDDAGGWKPACEPDAYGEQWGFPVTLPPEHPGRENEITLTCASGAVAKCARFGYKPWVPGDEGKALLDLHAACVHMVRADYCGDGEAYTRDGTAIDIYDDLGVQMSDGEAAEGFSFEAGWTRDGAACVAHTRWPELIDRAALAERCPRLAAMPVCDEDSARASGARLFNRSVIR